jgi:hypothetical protein
MSLPRAIKRTDAGRIAHILRSAKPRTRSVPRAHRVVQGKAKADSRRWPNACTQAKTVMPPDPDGRRPEEVCQVQTCTSTSAHALQPSPRGLYAFTSA